MSENRNRDYSKYDAMTTEDLEEILRLDASALEEDSDTELLLYLMGVLANRRKNSTGKTAQQAWESFQQNYLSEEEECPEDTLEVKRPAKRAYSWMRWLIASAAAVVLVVSIPLTANAFSLEELWNVFARWAKETFSFVSDESAEVTEPDAEYDGERDTLQALLNKNKINIDLVPTWIPDGFELDKVEKDVTPEQRIYRGVYLNGEEKIIIRVQTYIVSEAQKIEINEDLIEIYESSGVEYYIFTNNSQIHAIWINDSYECYIAGNLTIEEIKLMIDSIGKG